jgi:septum formation protein
MLVLASASPRRRELLTQAGYTFTVRPAHIPEDPHPNEDPIAYVTRLAREKAEAVFAELSSKTESGAPGPGSPRTGLGPWGGDPSLLGTRDTKGFDIPALTILGADTTVTLDNHILGKPEDPADAARILRLLSGRTHNVITGIALVTAHSTRTAHELTSVQFLPLTEEEIAAYIATGEPMDKAGAYAIQGRAARWIPRIEGCYFNVVGLPISLVSTMLQSIRLIPAAQP